MGLVKLTKQHDNLNVVMISILAIALAMLPGFLSLSFYLFLFFLLIFKYSYSPIFFMLLGGVSIGNELLFSGVQQFSNLKYLLIILFFLISVSKIKKTFVLNKILFFLILILILIFTHSVFFSQILILSLLKLLSWFVFIFSLSIYFLNQTHDEKLHCILSLNKSMIVLLILSLPLLLIPEIGYLKNGQGFQGFSNQPQVFGSFVGALAILNLLLFFKKNKYLYILIFSISSVLIVLSQSRTAGLAFFLAILITLFMVFSSKIKSKANYFFSKKSLYYACFILLLAPLIVIMNMSYLSEYINKRGTDAIGADGSSRSGLISNMMLNIDVYFLEGIGFGLPSNLDLTDASYLPIVGLPISVPIEKGVLYLAVFEELGLLFGFTVLILIFIISFHKIYRNSYFSLIVFVLGTNLAENTFFSIGGIGMMLLILYFASINFRN